ncbi:TPA: hypothetical protein L4559_003433 [Pseudomonas aeruginosa]|nr:hypothetical protein [Pseudomonas aeruginosa]
MSAQTKKISELTVSEWAAKLQTAYENPITITLNPDGSGIIHSNDKKPGSTAYFHRPEDALHWLGLPETEIEV